jgi:hypothetical protein
MFYYHYFKVFMKFIYLLTILTIFFTSHLFSFHGLVSQTPNGTKFNCVTCHINPNGSGLNSFGKSIVPKYLKSGIFSWGAEFAGLDADNDGFTNGKELGDPNGTWKTGDPAPGVLADISNPGDASSVPPSNLVEAIEYINRILTYPNPVTKIVNINFTLSAAMPIRFDVYNTIGELIFSSVDYYMNEGENSVSWNTSGNNGSLVPSGDYIMAIKTGNSVKSNIISVIR